MSAMRFPSLLHKRLLVIRTDSVFSRAPPSPPLVHPSEARVPGARHGLTQASETDSFIGSYSDIISQTALQSWDQGWDQEGSSPVTVEEKVWVAPYPGLS